MGWKLLKMREIHRISGRSVQMFEKNKVKVYVMREVFVIAFSMFPLPLPQQKRKTKEQKRPARKETTVFPARAPVPLEKPETAFLSEQFFCEIDGHETSEKRTVRQTRSDCNKRNVS